MTIDKDKAQEMRDLAMKMKPELDYLALSERVDELQAENARLKQQIKSPLSHAEFERVCREKHELQGEVARLTDLLKHESEVRRILEQGALDREKRGAESMARYLYLKVFAGDEVDVQESLDNWELENNAK